METHQTHLFTCNPKKGIPEPFVETINGVAKTIAFCSTKKMVEELAVRLTRLDAYQHLLETLMASKMPAEEIREQIKSSINLPDKVYKERDPWSY